jgi:hypothetical protein
MAARQVRVLAGSASALAAVMLALAGCAAAGHLAAATVPRPASQSAATGHASLQTASGTAVRRASRLLKCVDPVPPRRASRGPVRQLGVANLSRPGLVMLCGPVVRCPPGFHAIYPRARSGRRPRVQPVFDEACISGSPGGTPPPEPLRTPEPYRTPPLRTMPPQPPGA